jgi:hypothetical protein
MPKITTQFKEAVADISKQDLEKLILKAASKNKEFHNFVTVNYVDKEFGEKDLFEQAVIEIDKLTYKSYKGFSEELRMANMLAACNKRIDEFAKVCKDKSLVLDLIMIVLKEPFSLSTNMFMTCFTNYNYRVYLLLKKAITIVENKLHEDFKIQYAPILNEYLQIFHRTSSHLDYVYGMQKEIKI